MGDASLLFPQPHRPHVSSAACAAFNTAGSSASLALTAQQEQSHTVTAAVTAVTSQGGAGLCSALGVVQRRLEVTADPAVSLPLHNCSSEH